MALITVPHPLAGIFLHGRPKIALLEHFECEEDHSKVVLTDAFVYFEENLGRLDAIEASEERR